MSVHTPDAGSVGLTMAGTTAVVTTAGGIEGWVNDHVLYIGIGLTLLSLAVGIVFKILNMIQNERHHREALRADKIQNEKAHEVLLEEIRSVNRVS